MERFLSGYDLLVIQSIVAYLSNKENEIVCEKNKASNKYMEILGYKAIVEKNKEV